MPPPQFSLKTMLWFTLAVAVGRQAERNLDQLRQALEAYQARLSEQGSGADEDSDAQQQTAEGKSGP